MSLFVSFALISPILPPYLAGVASLLGNGVLLLVAYQKRSTLKPAEFFIINLAISDLGMTISLFPLAIPSAFAHRYVVSRSRHTRIG